MSATLAAEPLGAVAPTKLTVVQAETLRAKAANKLAFAKALLMRALRWAQAKASTLWAFAKSFASKYALPASIVGGLVMSTRSGFKAIANGAVTATTWVAKGAVKVARFAARTAGKAVGFLSNIVGFFNKDAGKAVRRWGKKAVAKVDAMFDRVNATIDSIAYMVRHTLTANSTANIVNTGAAITTGAVAVNAVAGGAIAAAAVDVPVIGSVLAGAVAGGPLTFLALGAALVAGVAYTLFFSSSKKNKKPKKAEEVAAEAAPEVIQGTVLKSVDEIVADAATDSEAADIIVEHIRDGVKGRKQREHSGKTS